MAEGFEQYHVPQQSRRDKLRVGAGAGAEPTSASLHGLLPHYDPSLLPSDLLSCAAATSTDHGFHSHHLHPLATAEDGGGCKSHSVHSLVKEEGGCRSLIPPSSSSSSSTHHHQLYGLDPPPQLAVNPSCSATIHDLGSNSAFLYAPQTLQNLRDFAHSYNNTLSLSLSSHDNHADNNRPNDNLSLPLELNLQRYGSNAASAGGYLIPAAVSVGGGLASNEVSRSSVPLGPFTGYSSILKGSRFLRPAQQLLEELCDVGRTGPVEKIGEADSSLVVDASALEGYLSVEDSGSSLSSCGGDAGDVRRKKSRLISMLEEVCRRYKQYYQQMQDVVASFEYVAGFGNAAPYANLALKAMSKHFRCLKSAITDQLQLNKEQGNPGRDDGYPRLGSKDGVSYGQRPLSSSGYFDHHQPVWRPQRGLPERAVTVLRAWLFEHFLHPYPTDTDKIMLAKQTGLSRSQVSNWFINARVRLWKPMVEEIHMLETQQAQKASNSQREDGNADNNSSRPVDHQLPMASETPSTSSQRVHEPLSNKRTRSDLPEFPMRNDSERPHHLSYDPSTHPHHVSVGEGIRGLNNSVSLTLGLRQNNNGMSLPEAFQVNAVQRFGLGLEGSSEGFVLSGYEGQDRQFGRDVYGGQLLHDFVG
ncbi:BEL1-like homeodomain protein 9 [Punica granatum]|uniref:Homeobox domain-containing protein n=2 Tax=Punica granatum TaxID=22663 RepID=A0A218W3F8_PUNGR|nr:BEL1-like homeodomain protein 9 [Punica granatum]OWM67166.1 hypothetical protein CDL15_Pgr000618 [Punica granatum]PKI55916.1 hypothetical protein CRG98_023701 [Punica granatum]